MIGSAVVAALSLGFVAGALFEHLRSGGSRQLRAALLRDRRNFRRLVKASEAMYEGMMRR